MFSARVLCLGLMKFLSTFVYTAVFVNKDTLIVTTPGLGPAAIPVLKGAVMLAVAFIISGYYGKLTAKYALHQTMKGFLIFFACFFLVYGWLLFPYQDSLQLDFVKRYFAPLLGEERSYLYGVVVHWYHTLFFIVAELWGQFMIVTLFWGVANSISGLEDAKKHYAFYTAAGNFATFISGLMVGYVTRSIGDFQQETQVLMGISILLSLAMYVCLLRLDREMETVAASQKPSKKNVGGFFEAFGIVMRSKHLLAVFFVVAGFSFTMNMVELFWKDALRTLYPDPSMYRAVLGDVIGQIGLMSFLMALFVSVPMLRFFSWRTNALTPPILIGAVAMTFMLAYLGYYSDMQSWTTWQPTMMLLVSLGSIHNISAKVLKYTIFDPTKEMALIPIPYDEKVRGKAAVDVLSSRMAKSGSYWVQLIALEISGHVLSGAGFLIAPILAVTFFAWIYGVVVLDRRIREAV